MHEPIDISLTVSPELTRWPGSPEIRFDQRLALSRGDPATDTTISFSVHTGTHVDAPAHILAHGTTVEELPLASLLGRAYVVAFSGTAAIRKADLVAADIPPDTRRLLIRTDNSEGWRRGETGPFRRDYVALTADAAHWLVEREIGLVGVDYLSVQRFGDPSDTHETLLGAGIVVVEGLNLAMVSPGEYEFYCLPIKLAGVEGAPARAVLCPIRG